jgi:hypothetical protein
MKKWMLSVVLPIIGILGLCLLPAKKVNANTSTVQVGTATLSSDHPYTVDGSTAASDPGEGSRGKHYALFDAANGTLTLYYFNLTVEAEGSKNCCIYFHD